MAGTSETLALLVCVCQHWLMTSRYHRHMATEKDRDGASARVRVDKTIQPVFRAQGRLAVWTRATLELPAIISDGSSVQIVMVLDEKIGQIVAESVTITRSGPGAEVTARFLREVKVHNAMIKVVMNHMIRVLDGPRVLGTAAKVLAEFTPAKGRDRSAVLQDVAIVYEIAALGAWPPLKTIADTFEISQSTATRYVSEAREAGYLDSQDPSGA